MTGESSVLRIEGSSTPTPRQGALTDEPEAHQRTSRRTLEDMAVRRLSEATIRNYSRHIAELAKFPGRLPTRQARRMYAGARCT